MKKFNFKNYIYPLILLGIVLVLFVTNYKVGTWLLGWDVVLSEFNLSANFNKFFYGVWSEFQGVGASTIYTYSADLPRFIILFILSLLLPLSMVRWVYTFLMLALGTVSCYYLLIYLINKVRNLDDFNLKTISFIGALLYLLNLGTMQNYLYTPLSMFTTFFGILPLICLFVFQYLEDELSNPLIKLTFAFLFFTPIAITTTNFLVVFVFILLICSVYLMLRFRLWKQVIKLMMIIIFVNLFWMVNFIYSTTQSSQDVIHSKINRMASENAFEFNKEVNTLTNTLIMKGFWFENIQYDGTSNTFQRQFTPYINHLKNPYILITGYLVFLIGFIGFLNLFINVKKGHFKPTHISIMLITLVCFFMILNENPPFGFIFKFIRDHNEMFKESFRFVHNKFINFYLIGFVYFFANGLAVLLVLLKNKSIRVSRIFYIYLVFSIIIFMFPAFRGNLIYKNMKSDLPEAYIQVSEHMNKQDENTRVALLPQAEFWSWFFTKWGYSGSGFFWYGFKQPVVGSFFIHWNSKNERFFDDLYYAVYSQNPDLLSSTFQKYDVGFLILDKSIIAPGAPNATFIPQTKKLLSTMPNVTLDKTFGDIEVYKVNLPVKSNKWVVAPKKYINTKTSFEFSNIDSFSTWGLPYVNYTSEVDNFSTSSKNNFPSLMDFPFADDNKLAVAVSQNNLQVLSKAVSQKVVIPNLPVNKPLAVNLSLEKNKLKIKYIYPKIVEAGKTVYAPEFSEEKDIKTNAGNLLINGKIFTGLKTSTLIDNDTSAIVFDSKLSGFTDLSNEIYTASAVDCGGGTGEFGKRINQSAKSIQVFLRNKNSCVVFNSELAVKKESVVKVEFEYKATEGSRPLYCLTYNDLGGCLNQKYENAPKAVGNGFVKYLDYVYVKDATNFKFLAILESDDKQKEQSAEFKNIVVTSYNVLNKISLAPNINAYNIGKNLQVAGNVRVVLPDYSNLNKDYKAGDFAYNSTPKNCDNFNETSFDRKFSLGKYTYSAEDAISCDTLDTANINTNSSYLIDFVYKNIEGKGLDLCFASGVLQKCMLQDRLLTVKNRFYDTGSVKTESFILPSYPEASKIQINIGNQSIGRVKTVNELYSVNTKYIPYEWLKEIYTMSSSQSAPGGNVEAQALFMLNSLEVLNVKKTQTYKYDVTTNGKSGLLVLNQSFDKGWVMYKKGSCLFALTTPLTCFDIVKEHNLVSNWANGWLISSDQNIQDTKYTIKNTDFVIIFWPQYMQFAGYFILVAWFFLLIILVFRKYKE